MARRKPAALAAPFQGRWRIALWDQAATDLLGSAFLETNGEQGEMNFIAVTASLDVPYDASNGGPVAEFSWEGLHEGNPSCGGGWLAPAPPAASSVTSTSTTVTIQASSASRGDFFNSLGSGPRSTAC